jgi:hypothetical protein
MSVVYGYETAPRDDPIIGVVDKAVNLAVASIRPEVAAFLGFLPFRKLSGISRIFKFYRPNLLDQFAIFLLGSLVLHSNGQHYYRRSTLMT